MTGEETSWTYHECPFCGEEVGRLPAHLQKCEDAPRQSTGRGPEKSEVTV